MAPKRMTKNNFALLNSILKKDIEVKVEEVPVITMEADVVVSEPIIISDNVDFETENQCFDIETVEQIIDTDSVFVHEECAETKTKLVNKLF